MTASKPHLNSSLSLTVLISALSESCVKSKLLPTCKRARAVDTPLIAIAGHGFNYWPPPPNIAAVAPPPPNADAPPGGACNRVVLRSVMKLPLFWFVPLANALDVVPICDCCWAALKIDACDTGTLGSVCALWAPECLRPAPPEAALPLAFGSRVPPRGVGNFPWEANSLRDCPCATDCAGAAGAALCGPPPRALIVAPPEPKADAPPLAPRRRVKELLGFVRTSVQRYLRRRVQARARAVADDVAGVLAGAVGEGVAAATRLRGTAKP